MWFDSRAGPGCRQPVARVRIGLGSPSQIQVDPSADHLQSAQLQPAPELSVVVPTFNERENIPRLVDTLKASLPDVAWELIVVDDNSPDGTFEVAKRIAAADARIRCIRRVGIAIAEMIDTGQYEERVPGSRGAASQTSARPPSDTHAAYLRSKGIID